MKIDGKKEILEILAMGRGEFETAVMAAAKQTHINHNQNRLVATAMLSFDNICKNNCLYCGMRSANRELKRFRLDKQAVISAAETARGAGFGRIFLISGEDAGYGFENILDIVKGCKRLGHFVSLALGEFSGEQFKALADEGCDEYVLKFEMAQEQVFNRLKPSTSFKKRMRAIEDIKKAGMLLASGNIVDYPGQTDEHLAEDILLMKSLGISWAPVIPYLPVAGTPLAQEGGRGSLLKNLKEISMLRIMMPEIRITAQQPGEDLTKGLADPDGNLSALAAGADSLFVDILPAVNVKEFRVVDSRAVLKLEHIEDMAERSGMKLVF